jgi:AraC-like DNA-binding protein
MIFEQYIPAYPLNVFIANFIYYRDYNPVHSLDRFLPDGDINVVIDLTDYPKFIYDNETLKEIQACKHVWFSGIRTNYITIPSGRDSEMFVINFKKGKAYPFVQVPLDELTDSVVDGDLILTKEIMNMREMILSLPTIPQKFQYAELHLLKQFANKLQPNPFVDDAVEKIIHSPDQITMKKLAEKVGYSQKHFIRIFRKNVGLAPKAFLKVIRFQKAIQELEFSKYINWASIALDCGYYDQAHFINDFKHFSGFTPQQYMRIKNDQLNYVPVS